MAGEVAVRGIGHHRRVEEGGQALPGPGLPRSPVFPQAAGPVRGPGQQAQLVQVQAGNLGWRGRQTFRGGRRGLGLRQAQTGPPEGGEDLEGLASPGLDLLGFQQQPAPEAAHLQAVAQFPPQALFQVRLRRGIAAVKVEGLGLARPRELANDGEGVAAADDQATTPGAQVHGQGRQAVMEPPAAGAAQPPGAGGVVIEDEEGNERGTAGHRRPQGRMVGEPVIVAEPEDDGSC